MDLQSALKPGTVLSTGQVIRIPANQNIVGPNQVHQIQMPGRPVQYVRLVSTPSSGTSNVVTVGKPKTQGTIQTVGVTQKISGQQQIVKVRKNFQRFTPKFFLNSKSVKTVKMLGNLIYNFGKFSCIYP